jgi:hypothetical protein
MTAPAVELLPDADASYSFHDTSAQSSSLKPTKTPAQPRDRHRHRQPDAAKNAREIIPEAAGGEVLQYATLVGDRFHAVYLKDAHTQVKVFDQNGKHLHDVNLPGIGSAGGFGGKRTDTETFYTFSGFTTPTTIFRYNAATANRACCGAQGRVRPIALRDQAGLLQQQGRHPHSAVPRASQGLDARRQQPDSAVWLRRLQRLDDPVLFHHQRGLDGDGRRLCRSVPTRRR